LGLIDARRPRARQWKCAPVAAAIAAERARGVAGDVLKVRTARGAEDQPACV